MPQIDLDEAVRSHGDRCPRCVSPRTVLPHDSLIDWDRDAVTCWYACHCGHRWTTECALSALAE